jgi:DNA-binding transcriptional LysR family regulator
MYFHHGEFAPARASVPQRKRPAATQAVKQGEAIAVLPNYVACQDGALVPVLPEQIDFRRACTSAA